MALGGAEANSDAGDRLPRWRLDLGDPGLVGEFIGITG
jgi:hypothetical protein